MFYPLVCALCFAHLVADYPLQTDWMAANKHSDRRALWLHSSVHGVVAAVAVVPFAPLVDVLSVAVIVPLFHATTDARDMDIREDQTTHLCWCVVTATILLIP